MRTNWRKIADQMANALEAAQDCSFQGCDCCDDGACECAHHLIDAALAYYEKARKP